MNVGCAADRSYGGVSPRSASSNATSLDVVRTLAPHAESTASSHLLFLAVIMMGL
jgi:hypothetical protein